MSKKFGLISGIEEDGKKTKYQVFEATLGFEHAEILIPFDKADEFMAEAISRKPKSKATLNKLASNYGGKVL
jgi:hypothetical protein